MRTKYFLVLNLTWIVLIVLLVGCRKLVDVNPPDNSLSQENTYDNDNTAASVLSGIYAGLANSDGTGFEISTLSKWAGLSSDEFELWTGATEKEFAYFTNTLSAPTVPGQGSDAGSEFWGTGFRNIFICNSAIEGITNSSKLSPAFKTQLLGEAKFLRAFIYFYLANLYGDLPLVTSTNPQVNRSLARIDKSLIYQQIIKDLKEAQELLSSDFLNKQLLPYTSNSERVRPTKWAATALLARVYLYTKEYAAAEVESSKVISNSSLFNLSSLNDVFLKNSKEAIWQLQPVNPGWNTEDAKMFNLAAPPAGFTTFGYPNKVVFLSSYLLNSFEVGDSRFADWIGVYNDGNTYYFPNKYKEATQDPSIVSPSQMLEYRTVFRLAEQYLIRAEARCMVGNIPGGVTDLNIVRSRARAAATSSVPNPLPDISVSVSQDQLRDFILHERQIELFSEWGQRWFDLKRTNKADQVMGMVTLQKGGSWQPTDQLYPIPYSDIVSNPKLLQNAGY